MLINFTQKGIYCPIGDFYIDSLTGVDTNVITHAHSDHARFGSKKYISHNLSVPILKLRLSKDIDVLGLEYGEVINIKGVKLSLHPSGHIIGSSQIRLEYKGEVVVVAGDYKVEDDLISTRFEPIKCNSFVTESTFALPIFKWKKQEIVFNEINQWWAENKSQGLTSILFCYTLGKSQRVLRNIDTSIGKIICHGSTQNINDAFRSYNINLPHTYKVSDFINKEEIKGSLVIAPSSAMGTSWLKRFYPYSLAQASGWMQIKGIKKRGALDRGFILSDHADWSGLNKAIKETGAENIFVKHGYKSILARWLIGKGLNAVEIN